MKYVFDIDETICTKTKDGTYTDCEPIQSRIDFVNELFDDGHTITFQTARGMGRTNNNQRKAVALFYDLTEYFLEVWGVKYHSLFLGKPSGDIYIDDKGINDKDFFK